MEVKNERMQEMKEKNKNNVRDESERGKMNENSANKLEKERQHAENQRGGNHVYNRLHENYVNNRVENYADKNHVDENLVNVNNGKRNATSSLPQNSNRPNCDENSPKLLNNYQQFNVDKNLDKNPNNSSVKQINGKINQLSEVKSDKKQQQEHGRGQRQGFSITATQFSHFLDTFLDVLWFITCSIGFIIQVFIKRSNKSHKYQEIISK